MVGVLIDLALNVLVAGAMRVLGGSADSMAKWMSAATTAIQNIYHAGALLAWVAEYNKQAVQNSGGSWSSAGWHIRNAFVNVDRSLNHIVDVIIPMTAHKAAGYVGSHGLHALNQRVDALQKYLQGQIDRNARSVKAAIDWENGVWRNYGDAWQFAKDLKPPWQSAYRPNLDQLIRWIQHPGDWTDWLAGPMAGSLLNWLSDPNHLATADNWTLLIVNRADDVSANVQKAALAILQETAIA